MNKARVKAAAPELLEAAKAALGLLIADSVDVHRRPAVIRKLQQAIDLAESPSLADAATITFVVTDVTARVIDELLRRTDDGSPAAKALRKAVADGTRVTKQRIYIKLDADIPLLKRLKQIFQNADVRASRKALDRLVAQIDQEVLSKSPLQQLADMGL